MIIDLSKYNVVTDWKKVQKSVSGAILRCGYRGYSSGKIVEDAKFKEFAAACKQHNIPFGLYFMSQAITSREGQEEAEYAIGKAKEYGATLPIYIDSEDGDGTPKKVRADGLPKDLRTLIVRAFCDTVIRAGFLAGVYASESWYMDNLDYGRLKNDYLIWVAKYGKNSGKKTTNINLDVFHMHQYTSRGTVHGVGGYVDLNEGDIDNMGMKKQQDIQDEPVGVQHIQLNYQAGKEYTVVADGLRIRTKGASQSALMLPNAAITGTVAKGAKVKNQATARVEDAIWMYIGLDKKGREQWVCADTGSKTYIR